MFRPIPSRWPRGWLAGLACLLHLTCSGASTNWGWFSRAWQTDEGLPDNSVVGVAQTADGFLWVATQNALVRFDGVRFREVEVPHAPRLRVGDNHGLALDSAGRLWLVKKRGGAICLDGPRSFSLTARDGLPEVPVTDMALDRHDAVWLSASGLGNRVARIEARHVTSFSEQDGLPWAGGCWLARDGNGELWFATKRKAGRIQEGKFIPVLELDGAPLRIAGARSGGLWLLAGSQLLRFTQGSEPVKVGELPGVPPSVRGSALYEDRAGRVWIGTVESGLFAFESGAVERVNTSHPGILCLTEDQEGNVWAGTDGGGLNRLRRRTLRWHDTTGGPVKSQFLSACVDKDGDVWAVTDVVARRRAGAWTTILTNRAENTPNFVCVAADPKGGVWVGLQYGGLLHWNGGIDRAIGRSNGLASGFVRALLVTPAGDVWIGTERPHTLQRLRGEEIRTFPLPPGGTPVKTLAVDGRGQVWAGTADGFLLRVSDEGLVDETRNTLSDPRAIHTLCVTPDDSLWIGYAGGGLGRLKAGRFTQFRQEQGLRENNVVQMMPDGQGWLWLAGNQELSRVRLEDFDAVEAGRASRVQAAVCGRETGVVSERQPSQGFWPNAVRSLDGRLWFPMLRGLLEVDRAQVGRNPLPPPVVIEQVSVDGQSASLHHGEAGHGKLPRPAWLEEEPRGMGLRLPAGHQPLELQFTALSFADPRNVAFKYRLEGLEKHWTDAGGKRVAQFSQLPAGDYRFQVIACNNDGVWNEAGASLAITVLTPFWLRAWFLVAAALTAAGTIAGAMRYLEARRMRHRLEQMEREQAVERERARIAKDMHDDLGARLSEITLLSELAQGGESPREEIQSDLRRIAAKARELTRSLAAIVWAVNPQHDAFDSFVTYTCNFAEDYLRLAGIRCRLDIPASLPQRPLTAHVRHNLFLLVKEALHNIVKHAAASDVSIRVILKTHGFQLIIQDNGRGFALDSPAAPGAGATAGSTTPRRPGHGLANMRQRAEDIQGRLELRTSPGQGTTVEFYMEFSSQ
ncbi:MAG: hypothetical protein RJA22_3127 [Verrucomicrobiota bacterium]